MRLPDKAVPKTTSSDAFAFVTRLRLAVEATATRDNIGQGLKTIAEFKL